MSLVSFKEIPVGGLFKLNGEVWKKTNVVYKDGTVHVPQSNCVSQDRDGSPTNYLANGVKVEPVEEIDNGEESVGCEESQWETDGGASFVNFPTIEEEEVEEEESTAEGSDIDGSVGLRESTEGDAEDNETGTDSTWDEDDEGGSGTPCLV